MPPGGGTASTRPSVTSSTWPITASRRRAVTPRPSGALRVLGAPARGLRAAGGGVRRRCTPGGRRRRTSAAQRLDPDAGRARIRAARGLGEAGGRRAGDLEPRLAREDLDLADVLAGDLAAPAQEREDPARVRLLVATDRQPEPDRVR